MSIAPKLRDMHKLGADSCDPEFLDALLGAANEIDDLRKALTIERAARDHWHGLVPRADRVQFPFIPKSE